ncbi:MAG TPA: 4-(cytidine 5'-diphospho)-2-C-methyl-D-erythritol kinase [Bacteroidales bacterium]|jgi:4-diphosphocytidyl-2-C-methyl-D-erythritol kinase|nr:4-(cytidine 5'-diphospho)-2-C-methyl-D-erythritol kinase [Bacteroidales bacterium]MDI9573059.1 4-(cytidine 5'-diphospho)-2-C-methyl-D-erythritol kinase [Bacteroidota bacterium]OQC62081.1 MAG: 4-diphosphocytidyl-2-C-methyl-D-erythritol kinase [Bacteroidetes bacterium ADurb.Bin012]MBP9511631.1 4-(cytidine 5'-diphospho)-2-C-methyl-D-erythritol kinase [Bacteroidales bacterium]MBP9588107.1 4-(cytidine 5'-diphospho)-2-C-methyl-D-erythritol kinase [Bacteroidales bacterium]
MIVFANAKINLGLRIIRKRSDNYHDILSVFYPIPLVDVIEIDQSKKLEFYSYGLSITAPSESNLCVKAWNLLFENHVLTPVAIYLLKNIPTEAGLGGGSSDASFILKALNEMFHLGLSHETLSNYALQLGSDCPFFIHNKPMLVSGCGEVFTPVTLSLEGLYLVLIQPNCKIHTAEAYSHIQPRHPAENPALIVNLPLERWREKLVNDFEDFVFEIFPEVGIIKEKLYDEGAVYASMSGSGSSVYGIFRDEPPPMPWANKYFYRVFILD